MKDDIDRIERLHNPTADQVFEQLESGPGLFLHDHEEGGERQVWIIMRDLVSITCLPIHSWKTALTIISSLREACASAFGPMPPGE